MTRAISQRPHPFDAKKKSHLVWSIFIIFFSLSEERFAYVFSVDDPSSSHSCMISLIESKRAFWALKGHTKIFLKSCIHFEKHASADIIFSNLFF